MPGTMATDAEVTAAITTHVNAADPHPIYLTQTEGDARYRQSAIALTDSDIPAAVARDAEVTAVMNTHLVATDPHSQYLLQSEGDARYRLTSTLLTDADIPAAVARDAEVTAVMNTHLAAADPHTQYATQARGDARYFRGRSQIHTLDPPNMAPGELYKVFFSFVGAKLNDVCLVTPIGVNLFATGLWPFHLQGVVENADMIAIYLVNGFNSPLDLGSFQIRALVINF